MNKRSGWIWLLALALAAGVGFWLLRGQPPGPAQGVRAQVVGLDQPEAGFARAAPGRSFTFPQDDGAHPEFQTEWWYYTGNVYTAEGRPFGFQLTFFRRGLLAQGSAPERSSEWRTDQVYLAHFALSDIQGGGFMAFERSSRGALGLAGAEGEPQYRVWLDDWSVEQAGEGRYHLRAAQEGIALDLDLEDLKGPVLQGEDGYSRKGEDPGNASYYVSRTRLSAQGRLALEGETYELNGSSWMDHEFSTSALAAQQVGWDWFALQLDDGSELMVYQMRHQDGSLDPYSSGASIDVDGRLQPLAFGDYHIEATHSWKSPHSGAVYPAGWRIQAPGLGLDLEILPAQADQELDLSFTYWEGAVTVHGQRDGQELTGRGYVELTGYAHSMQGQF
ncbi:MAG: carotenoid 1,2-hydratase [Chloroflexi bacterium]|nr:carotenoid 1,2-hydratase [Chloroflexota bacterium]